MGVWVVLFWVSVLVYSVSECSSVCWLVGIIWCSVFDI